MTPPPRRSNLSPSAFAPWALLVSALIGCAPSDVESMPGHDEPEAGQPQPPDRRDGGDTRDAHVDPDEPVVDAGQDASIEEPVEIACDLPMGEYTSTLDALSGGNENYYCIEPRLEDFTWENITAPQSGPSNGYHCQASAYEFSPDRCSYHYEVSCTDGSSVIMDCTINASASVIECKTVHDLAVVVCTTRVTDRRIACPEGVQAVGDRCIPDCPPGFAWNRLECVDIDECEQAYCGEHGSCQNSHGGYTCDCEPGYSHVGAQCELTDACLAHGLTCDPSASCDTSVPGAPACVCHQGFLGDGETCEDDDECARQACGLFRPCTNLPGSHECGPVMPHCEGDVCTCPDGLSPCGDECVDLATDRDHCGECDAPCHGDAQACSEGTCGCLDPELERCGDECFDTDSDRSHCGSCDEVCEIAAESCVAGSCQCPIAGQSVCGEVCVDLASDRSHCGTCGQQCTLCPGACVDVEALATQLSSNCALMNNGEVHCWGQNNGQLGDGTTTRRSRPVRVELSAGVPLDGVSFLSLGLNIACAVLGIGEAYCWGNASDAIGGGPIGDARRPVRVELSAGVALSGISQLSTSGYATCARLASGEAYCWGTNSYGELGNGSTQSSSRPVRVEMDDGVPLTDVVFIQQGGSHSCALLGSGEVYCWGINANGDLGDGSSDEYSARPVRVELAAGVPLEHVVELHGTCARTAEEELYCWGYNYQGILGNGSNENSARPVRVETEPGVPLSGVARFGGTAGHRCAVLGSGSVYCWGQGSFGELGNGQSAANGSSYASFRPVQVQTSTGPLDRVLAMSVTAGNSCAMRDDGGVYCWGLNAYGEAGIGATGKQTRAVRVETSSGVALANVQELSAGYRHFCARQGAAVRCWGESQYGQIGDGYTVTRTRPSTVSWP